MQEEHQNKYNWEELVDPLQEKVFSKTNPRIENQRLLLTYKTHIDKDLIRDKLNQLNKKECARIEIAHEIGNSKNVEYPHTHVAVDFGKKYINKRSDCMRVFDIEGIHPNIKPISSMKHWKNTLQYLGKEDPDNKHLLKEFGDPSEGLRSLFDSLMNSTSVYDSLCNHATKMNEIIPVMQAFDRLSLEKTHHDYTDGRQRREIDIKSRNWYKPILELDKVEPDDRSVHWFFDPVGGRGKTTIAKYMEEKYDNRWIYECKLGGVKDATLLILNQITKGWKQWGVLIDLSRVSQEYHTVYDAIEHIKNGMMTSTKYHTTRTKFLPPHVVVLSNKMPELKYLSRDRWNLWEIVDDNTSIKIESEDHLQRCMTKDFDANYAGNEERFQFM